MALTDTYVRQIKHSNTSTNQKHTDGQGLYLLVTATGKYWRMDYRFLNKRKTLAMGVYPSVSLAKARKKRDEAKELLADNIDPNEDKRTRKHAQLMVASHTFELIARQWLEKTKATRAASTQEKIENWLKTNVFPYIGSKAISSLNPPDVLAVLRKIESRGAFETAHRVKQVCGQIFRFAVSSGIAERDVTADLRGALTTPVKTNYAAITDPKPTGELLRAIDTYIGHPCAVAALKIAPLVFVRPGELRSAEWAEIDLEAAAWEIPAHKMKMKVAHLVPLSDQSVAILRNLHPITGHGKFVFPSIRTDAKCMSENTINAALRSLGYSKEVMTAHGFRAMARTIMDEVMGERVDLIEHQLAHQVKDANGTAYNRTKFLAQRKVMMQNWANYLDGLKSGATIIALKQA